MRAGIRQQAVVNSRSSKIFASAFCALLLAVIAPVAAQQPKKVIRIGYVDAGSPATTGHRADAFVQGLRDLGYVERQNIFIDYRWAEGKTERLSVLVDEVVKLKPDVIVSSATPAIRLAKQKTTTIPIV